MVYKHSVYTKIYSPSNRGNKQEMNPMAEEFINSRRKSSKPRNIKYNNQKLVLTLFRYADKLSVSEISERVGLSKTTITKIVGDLLRKKLILSAGKGDSTEEGGKKPELFTFNPTYQYIIMVNLPSNQVQVHIMDLKSRLVSQYTQEVEIPESDYPSCIQCAADAVVAAMKNFGIIGQQVCGVIICGDGIVDSTHGVIRYSVHHSWPRNLPILQDFASLLPFPAPIYIENGGALSGYADLLDPENQSIHSIIHLSVGQHSGGCVMKDHDLQNGSHGFMSEFGHIIVDPHSSLSCICGAKGCFEVMVSPTVVLRRTGELLTEYPDSAIASAAKSGTLTMEELFAAANEGEPCACQSMDQVIRWFTVLIRSMVIFHDPQKIIIQGVYQKAGSYFLDNLRSTVVSTPLFRTGADLLIDYASFQSNEALIIGASYYVCRKFLDNNQLYD